MRFLLLLCLVCILLAGCPTTKSRADASRRQIYAALNGYAARHHQRFPRTFAELQIHAAPIKPLDLSPFKSFEYRYESPDGVRIYTTP